LKNILNYDDPEEEMSLNQNNSTPAQPDFIVGKTDLLLVTGAAGFVGPKVVETLLAYGFQRIRCLVRPSSKLAHLSTVCANGSAARVEMMQGNLLSRDDCRRACEGVSVIYHVAAASEKSFAGTYLNTTVTTRNLLEAVVGQPAFKRFVNVSSLAVYSSRPGLVLDEGCPAEPDPVGRHDPYCYGKLRQDELVSRYGASRQVPYVIVRPGPIYGPRSRAAVHGRVGIDTFGVFLHLGGGNQVAFTYIDNCADAIVRAGLVKGIEGEVINVMDDDLPTSRKFLGEFKRQAYPFRSLWVPYPVFMAFSVLWAKYSAWSKGQLPPAFNRRLCQAYYRGDRYSNAKAKRLLGWKPGVATDEGIRRHCEYFKHQRKPVS
jgi:nucleoside-diphosphate-sugar epimerase